MIVKNQDELLSEGLRQYAHGKFDKAYELWSQIQPGDQSYARAEEYRLYLNKHQLHDAPGLAQRIEESRDEESRDGQPGNVVDAKPSTASPWDLTGTKDIAVDLDYKPFPKSALDEILDDDSVETHEEISQSSKVPAAYRQKGQHSGASSTDPSFSVSGDPVADMRRCFELGNFEGAIEVAQSILHTTPGQLDALSILEEAAKRQIEMYHSRLGGLDQRPRLKSSPDEIIWLNLHPRAGYLLSFVDGSMSFSDIVTVSGMPKVEVLGVMVKLLGADAIEVG